MSTQQVQVSILFADVQGFTNLKGGEFDAFMKNVMGVLATTAIQHRPRVKNTWGDAIFLVFNTANSAADCALALRDIIRNTVWPQKGIYTDLKMRIALHNAHATITKDPFTGEINAYGPQVNKAARLEPVAHPNEVFATEEFKTALDTFVLTVYEWDYVGMIPLAKDWGDSNVYRLRRPTEEKLSAERLISPHPKVPALGVLMPNTHTLLGAAGRHDREITQLISHTDNFLFDGIIRRNWTIQATYDTREIHEKGILIETIRWTYDLLNLRDTPMKYDLRTIGAPFLEGTGGLISWVQIDERGTETQLPLPIQVGETGEIFEVRSNEIDLLPNVINKFELRVNQTWPVSRENPTFHNAWAPRQVSFWNRLEVTGPFRRIGVLLGDRELQFVFHRDRTYLYNVPSPMLRDQLIEILMELDPL